VPVYLNENQPGSDRRAIGFPHLLICMGVVMQTGAWLYGYHFDSPNTTAESAAAFATTADIVVTPSNKDALHELNYFLRLVTVTV
jgi:hypothetical protein